MPDYFMDTLSLMSLKTAPVCSLSQEVASNHFTKLQHLAPFISVLGQIVPIVFNLRESQVFFHTIFPSLVWSTSLLPVDSSPKSICFGSLWSGILQTCASHLSLSLRILTSMWSALALCSTSMFVTRSHHLIFISCLRQSLMETA